MRTCRTKSLSTSRASRNISFHRGKCLLFLHLVSRMMNSVLKWASLNVQKASRYNLRRGTSYAISLCAALTFVQQQLSCRPQATRDTAVACSASWGGRKHASERSLTRGLRPALPVTVPDVSISYLYRLTACILRWNDAIGSTAQLHCIEWYRKVTVNSKFLEVFEQTVVICLKAFACTDCGRLQETLHQKMRRAGYCTLCYSNELSSVTFFWFLEALRC